jgi:CHAD domain-containing protein
VSRELPSLPEPPSPARRRPSRPAAKPRLELDPAERADRAARRLLAPLFEVLRSTEAGVREARDPELLHDYRVALRRTRTALSQLPGVFPERELEAFGREFAWLGQVTGPRRDHDVLVSGLDGYLQELPPWVRDDLQPLRRFIIEREAHEQEELVSALDSDRYRRLIRGWERFLARRRAASPPAAQALRPIRAAAGERLGRAWRQVDKRARAVGRASAPAEIHRLRIAAKKFRYLLEFFRSLYPAREVDRFVRSLKDLQDVLGTYNDLATQKRSLAAFAEELAAPGTAPTGTLLAAGYLLARLDDRQAKVGEQLRAALAKYRRSAIRERQRRLFLSQEEPA